MAGMDIGQIVRLAKQFGPPEEVKKAFYRTVFGSLVGQTFLLMGLLAIYFAFVAFVYSFAKAPLQAFRDDFGEFWFGSVLAAPLLCILLFQMLPTGIRAIRERRLKRLAIGGIPKPGYYRLAPYGPGDHELFKRLDGADAQILNWIKSASSSLLYLSGASGVGKSSILAASVLPSLREAGWAVAETRVFGNPMERIRGALVGTKSVFTQKPPKNLSIRGTLEKAAETRKVTPLLLVIDQFEEFLILHESSQQSELAALLDDLYRNPINGFRLLLVFRSDYRSLVFKLNLPPLLAANSYELAPYGRREAAALLKGGGRQLSEQALDSLFRGLDRIEDACGLYRPITLNMVGLVLASMGPTLDLDPSKLIQSYLTSGLTGSESRDFVKPVLAGMITEAGTKEPRTENELTDKTHFELWQVKATLADLAQRGLVRRLEGAEAIWEISHDFLARMIGLQIGRLGPTPMERVRPFVAPAVLAGWAATSALLLPLWQASQQRSIEQSLERGFGAIVGAEPEGMRVEFGSLDDRRLAEIIPFLERLNGLKHLTIDESSLLTSLEPLRGLSNLTRLDMRADTGITSLEPLKGLTNLLTLNLDDDTRITSLEPLKGLTNLSILGLSGTGVTSVEPLRGLTNLSDLAANCTGIASLEPLKGLTNLQNLELTSTRITTLEPLKGLTNLSNLYLSNTGVTSVEPLRGLAKLATLDVTNSPVADLTVLEGLTNLRLRLGTSNLNSLSIPGSTGYTGVFKCRGGAAK